MKVSVIIPFYSTKTGLLINAVKSALAQTISSLEVIVIDDASPLEAKKELACINDNRLKILYHKENKNGAIARNTGIKNANGEYIAFLDFDDIWYENKLERQLEQLKPLSESAVSYCQSMIIDDGVAFIRPKTEISVNEKVGDYLFCKKEIIQTSGILLKTSLAKKALFDDLKRHQDYQFCLRLENIGAKFHLLDGGAAYSFIQIPKLNDYEFSIWWLNNYGRYLSEDAKNGFRRVVVIRSIISHHHFYILLKYINGFSEFFYSSKFVFIKIIKYVVPGVFLNRLRS